MKHDSSFTESQISYVTDYVHSNYKALKGKALIIRKLGNVIGVLDHPDGSPLILSMKMLDKVD